MKIPKISAKKLLYICLSLISCSFLSLIFYTLYLKMTYLSSSSSSWYEQPVEIYGFSGKIVLGQNLDVKKVSYQLKKLNFKNQANLQYLSSGEFIYAGKRECKKKLKGFFDKKASSCFILFHKKEYADLNLTAQISFFLLNEKNKIIKIYQGFPVKEVFEAYLSVDSLAEFDQGQTVLKKPFEITEIPPSCLMSITAIEDSQFLDHIGFSFSGILRALYRNVFQGRREGGSTITQQLVKNYFLTPEKSLKRKFKELLISIMIEMSLTKDEILHRYLNIIYMGQKGALQVRGYGAASLFYFEKKINKLLPHECALLAAIVKSPGGYNPFRYPDKALQRRNHVIEKMREHQMISEREKNSWMLTPLPSTPSSHLLYQTTPYITQVIEKELKENDIELEPGLKIFTSLDLQAQKSASQSVYLNLENFNQKLEEENTLQSSLLSVHVLTGGIVALIGGLDFVKSQFNRVTMSQRQVGSTLKPFVYLLALQKGFSPLSTLIDEPFTYKGKVHNWSPKNYSKNNYGKIPFYFALKKSLNVATAKIAIQLGLDELVTVLQKSGITSPLKAFPSLALGAFETTSWDLTQSYLTLAQLGNFQKLHLVKKISDKDQSIIFEHQFTKKKVFEAEDVAILLSMLKQVSLPGGTAQSLKLRGLSFPIASKTGTTNNKKDAWFVGFTPYLLTTVWLGYDDNKSHGMTGASGALPIWASYMNGYYKYPREDFLWPKKTAIHIIDEPVLRKLFSDSKVFIEEMSHFPIEILLKD